LTRRRSLSLPSPLKTRGSFNFPIMSGIDASLFVGFVGVLRRSNGVSDPIDLEKME
jgi:hypothetical protein